MACCFHHEWFQLVTIFLLMAQFQNITAYLFIACLLHLPLLYFPLSPSVLIHKRALPLSRSQTPTFHLILDMATFVLCLHELNRSCSCVKWTVLENLNDRLMSVIKLSRHRSILTMYHRLHDRATIFTPRLHANLGFLRVFSKMCL